MPLSSPPPPTHTHPTYNTQTRTHARTHACILSHTRTHTRTRTSARQLAGCQWVDPDVGAHRVELRAELRVAADVGAVLARKLLQVALEHGHLLLR